MDPSLVDTDILSEVLKAQNANVLRKAQSYLMQHGRLAFSAITYYEVNRGIQARSATRQMTAFTHLAAGADVLPVTLSVLRRAADLWVIALGSGHPRDDADLIIAATALEHDRVLVTGNTMHFAWIPGLRWEDWRQP